MAILFSFCDQVADSHENHENVRETNQDAGNWMNCRREEQRVDLISQRPQRINAVTPKTWTEIVMKTDEK